MCFPLLAVNGPAIPKLDRVEADAALGENHVLGNDSLVHRVVQRGVDTLIPPPPGQRSCSWSPGCPSHLACGEAGQSQPSGADPELQDATSASKLSRRPPFRRSPTSD